MAYTDMFNAALDELSATLSTITGYPVVNDPRNINPPCILISAPSFDAFTSAVASVTFPVRLIGSGPGNLDALRGLLAMSALLMAKNVAVTSGVPTLTQVGGGEYPAYDLTVAMGAKSY